MTLEPELAAAIQTDYTKADVNEQDRAMLDYVAELTRNPAQMQRANLERLRQVGFEDRAILQITLIAGWFNYINRVADSLGVGR